MSEHDTKDPSFIDFDVDPATTGSLALDDLLLPGDVIAGRYQIVDVLGEGGFGIVYRAKQVELGSDVAIKTLRRSILDYEEASQRFRREAMLARLLTHPHTIRLYDFGVTAKGILFIAMEYLEGETVEERIERTGPIPMPLVHKISVQVAKSLMEAHQNGIVHRDLKPSNVFLCELPGEPDFVKVLDFGIAKVTQPWGDESWSNKLTQTGSAFGSPAYMSPEQVRGAQVTSASDIYACGLIMLEALTSRQVVDGNSPFDVAVKQASPTPIPIMPWLAESPMGHILIKAVAKQVEDRYANAAELLDDLERVDTEALEVYAGTLDAEVDFETLLQEAYQHVPTPSKADEQAAEVEHSRRGTLVVLAVAGVVIAALAVALVLGGGGSRRPEVEPPPAQTTQPAAPRVSMASVVLVASTQSAASGAGHQQRFPKQPLGVSPASLPIPMLPQATPAIPIAAFVNARRLIAAAPVAARLRQAQITTEHSQGLPITESALIASIVGGARLERVVLNFDSRPRGANVYRKGESLILGQAPLELDVIKAKQDVVYRFEARGYQAVDLKVSHNQSYNGFAYMRKAKGRRSSRRPNLPD